MFGISYRALIHIVNKAKEKMKTDGDFRENHALINSQIKM